MERTLGTLHPVTAEMLERYAELLAKTDRQAEATAMKHRGPKQFAKDRDAMWKWTHKDENKPEPTGVTSGRPSAAPSAVSLQSQEPVQKISTPQSVDDFHPDVTHIGKSIVIKGELLGGENVYLDGGLEGSIELRDGDLTVGPNGRIRASLRARNIVVQGQVNGNLHGIECVELKQSAVLVGDVCTQRIAIEEGAQLKGGVLVQKVVPRSSSYGGEKPVRE